MTTTGVQVPAGSIEAGEVPEQAAVRELLEETGRRGRVVRMIGTQRYDLRPARNEIAGRHYFEMKMNGADTTERWPAGETDACRGKITPWTCWRLPLTDAHVLAAGFGGLLGQLRTEDSAF